MKYFSYGSNMSLSRMSARVPSASVIGTYVLRQHSLKFHKSGKDGSGKCDAYYTGKKTDLVMGVLFEIDSEEKDKLDRIEGLGYGYDEKTVDLVDAKGDRVTAVTYVATNIDEGLIPYTWYKTHVLIGAREANLPSAYVADIEAMAAVKDKDAVREAKQLSIHGTNAIDVES